MLMLQLFNNFLTTVTLLTPTIYCFPLFIDYNGSLHQFFELSSFEFSKSLVDVFTLSVFHMMTLLLCGFLPSFQTAINFAMMLFANVKLSQFNYSENTGSLIALLLFLLITALQFFFRIFFKKVTSKKTQSTRKLTDIHYNERPVLGDVSCCTKICRSVIMCTSALLLVVLSPFALVILVLKVILGCCCNSRSIQKKKEQRQQAFEDLQTRHPLFPSVPPGSGAAILTGVRVLELATVVAGPSAGRLLADHGCEVIRVESKKGDMWRNYLKILERTRKTFTTTFEHTSFNKSCVVLDLKSKADLLKMKKLMSKADIFITNVRLPGLQKLGLDYASIKDEMPHLIYGHLTAWGLVGPARGDPGKLLGSLLIG